MIEMACDVYQLIKHSLYLPLSYSPDRKICQIDGGRGEPNIIG